MKKLIKAALLRLGVSEEHAEKLTASIPDALEAPKDLTDEQVATAAFVRLSGTLSSNDAFKDALKTVRGSAVGKLTKMLQAKMRKAFPGITEEEIEALPEENTLDALIELAATKVKPADPKEGDSASEVVKLNAQLKKAKLRIQKLENEELPAARSAGEAAAQRVRLERHIEQELGNKDAMGGELLVKTGFATPMLMDQLTKLYTLQEKKGGGVQLMKKGDDDKLVPAYGTDHNEITITAELRRIGTEAGLFKLNNGKAGDKGKGGDGGQGGGEGGQGGGVRRFKLRGEDKAKAHAEEFKKRRDGDGGSDDAE